MKCKIQEICSKNSGEKPSLLLHACCAPCATVCLERLVPFFNITVFFYNPNIDPKEEFDLRLSALQKYLSLNKTLKDVKLIVPENRRQDFLCSVDIEHFPERKSEKEGGERCKACYKFRLEKTAKFANENGFDYWATTLTVGPQKDATKINLVADEIQNRLAEGDNVFCSKFLYADFKKQNGFLRSIELCKEYGIYRQTYCGCVFGKANS